MTKILKHQPTLGLVPVSIFKKIQLGLQTSDELFYDSDGIGNFRPFQVGSVVLAGPSCLRTWQIKNMKLSSDRRTVKHETIKSLTVKRRKTVSTRRKGDIEVRVVRVSWDRRRSWESHLAWKSSLSFYGRWIHCWLTSHLLTRIINPMDLFILKTPLSIKIIVIIR